MYKKRYASQTIRGKLRVNNYLLANKQLKPHVPQTVSLSLAHLEAMTSRHSIVYIKPDVGSLGIGVFKLVQVESGYELYEIIGRKQVSHEYSKLSDVYTRLKAAHFGKLIIQKGITLDRVNDRPYDIRVMVQRKKRGAWVCTGMMVKVGAKDKIVTNYYQGGAIYTMSKLGKKQRLAVESTRKRIHTLKRTALRISHTLSKKRSGMHEMGIDFAYDGEQQLWVLEVNSNHPQFHPLKQLDPTAYNRMKRFAASYGRYSAK